MQHLSAGQAARGLGRKAVLRAVNAGRIPATKNGRTRDEGGAPRWRIRPDDVLAAAAQMRLDVELVRSRIAEQLEVAPARPPARLTDAERRQLGELLGER